MGASVLCQNQEVQRPRHILLSQMQGSEAIRPQKRQLEKTANSWKLNVPILHFFYQVWDENTVFDPGCSFETHVFACQFFTCLTIIYVVNITRGNFFMFVDKIVNKALSDLPIWSDHQGVFSTGFLQDLKDDVFWCQSLLQSRSLEAEVCLYMKWSVYRLLFLSPIIFTHILSLVLRFVILDINR